jgi:dihydrofolate reductase
LNTPLPRRTGNLRHDEPTYSGYRGKEIVVSKVVLDISISLDGFIAAAGQTADEPLGIGGERLHEWAFDDERGKELLSEAVRETGAVIVGRRTYDDSIRWWGADGPTGPARLPVFVPTHEPPASSPDGGVYTFVTDGIEATLEQARVAADGRTVAVGGGAETGRQCIRAGLVDELSLHVVPVLFGGGIRLFGELDEHLGLEQIAVDVTAHATHLRYRVAR